MNTLKDMINQRSCDEDDKRHENTSWNKVRVELIKFKWGMSYIGYKPFQYTPMR